jgi:hypothetical protein
MRRIIPILAAAALLVTAPTAAASRSMHRAPPTCRMPAHSRILVSDSQAMIYEDDLESIYGCAYSRGRSYLLGSKQGFSSSGGGGISTETVGGVMAAYEYAVAGKEAPTYWAVVVRNLQTGRVLRRIPTGVSTHPEQGFIGVGPTQAIVVKSDGTVAWIVETKYEPPTEKNHNMKGSEYAVEAVDMTGNRLLASGPGIDPSSLALAGSTLYWTQGGKPASAVLN